MKLMGKERIETTGAMEFSIESCKDSYLENIVLLVVPAITGSPAPLSRAVARNCRVLSAAVMVSTDHTKMVKWPPWARILHLPYLPISKLVFLT